MTTSWTTSTVGDQFDVQLGKMLDAAKNSGEPKRYLGNRAVQWGRIDAAASGLVPMSRSDLRRFRLRNGDLLVCEGGEVGRAAIWRDQLPECYYQKALHRLRPRSGYDVRLMQALLEYWASIDGFSDYVTQTSIAHLPRDKFIQIPLPCPPASEQQQIGDILEDLDNMIAILERLITKKQTLKQGMMQQLLTGSTRLPGFDKAWVERRIADIASITKGTQLGRAAMESGRSFPVWNGGIEPSGFTSKPNVQRPVVTVSEGGNSCGWVGRPTGSFWLGGHCYALDPKSGGHSVSFLYHRLKYAERQIMGLRVGSGLPNIQKKRLSDFIVSMPTDASEAAAIAQILEDADNELAKLDSRLTKARMIKVGMLQQLLTGRVCLPVEATS